MTFADDRIDLPVADTTLRSLINAPSPTAAAIPFSALLLTTAVLVKSPSLLFIIEDMLINTLMRDEHLAFLFEPMSYLFRAPVFADECFYLIPG